ncbi:TPA: elongation factor P maturation arginine rhamnosyltransferase EarP [Burkholderia aenigmatica]|uniref:elongation factor P maturation arginine rhamnosyltransferase EarP n=1 Tax=Burkholderia sp. AU45251 TaxID=3059204 RepID=UPI00264A797A|nr:elongation factor P maturation arginine rhamnosyltransferase EarP [Burkholderia sp. AU45251]HDR9486503.1 elongation factor P maturation arginine rhamnosyltransferase EarP [Burkholderia aenigmatica]MDN7518414.1 elongation factor P maturation arginine rhamnosyltransferase EarP [Burkholderia sp. AU45251]HDR9516998.1 elongation factor P maturation arginine rhamnosyltransferase EarP [Burkholderia aenigmatica]HDR9594923.1 elongation factor P maturation arginine rhamnosyltransferase EarP [Burkholde
MPRTTAAPLPAAPLPSGEPIACDLFCTVVDNFGDIGVCWRVARQLAHEHGWQVRLFVDDLRTFARLLPGVDPDAGRQTVDAIVVEHWHAEVGDALEIADVVIEAFACELPGAYLAAMARRARRPVWINLEYLSAEDWVADFHLRPSPHPRYPLLKTFFFPGLSAGTGGVLKEHDLDTRRTAFETDAAAQDAWWRRATGGPLPAPGTTVVSLFAYENPAVDALLAQWRDGSSPVVALVPAGRVSPAVARFFGVESFGAGTHANSGNLTAHGLAFVPQADYDPLLWVADINFVRGEDSFVRAQWARKPFVWHIYPQADDVHLPKLDAALAHLSADLADAPRAALERFWHAWNGVGTPDWADFWQHRAVLDANAARWADALAAVGDLAGKLAEYAKSQLK